MRALEDDMPEDDDELRATAVESMPGFDTLTDHDKVELVKFEHYLRVAREPKQPIEGAYAHVYGDVVYEADWPCMKTRGALCRHGECKP